MCSPCPNTKASTPKYMAASTMPFIHVPGSGCWASIFPFNYTNLYMQLRYYIILIASACSTGCTKDLNRQPLNSNTSVTQYSTPAGYKQALAKVYGSYSLASSSGTGVSDVNVAGI